MGPLGYAGLRVAPRPRNAGISGRRSLCPRTPWSWRRRAAAPRDSQSLHLPTLQIAAGLARASLDVARRRPLDTHSPRVRATRPGLIRIRGGCRQCRPIGPSSRNPLRGLMAGCRSATAGLFHPLPVAARRAAGLGRASRLAGLSLSSHEKLSSTRDGAAPWGDSPAEGHCTVRGGAGRGLPTPRTESRSAQDQCMSTRLARSA